MALILYPLSDYDAFTSVLDCDSILVNNVIGSQREGYDALDNTDKEIYIRQASLLIKQKITLPDALENDLKIATAYLVNHSVGVNMLNEDKKSNIKSKEIVDVVKTEYFGRGEDSNSFPDIVESLLDQYSSVTSSFFIFERA